LFAWGNCPNYLICTANMPIMPGNVAFSACYWTITHFLCRMPIVHTVMKVTQRTVVDTFILSLSLPHFLHYYRSTKRNADTWLKKCVMYFLCKNILMIEANVIRCQFTKFILNVCSPTYRRVCDFFSDTVHHYTQAFFQF
jgi:hypothetical protein